MPIISDSKFCIDRRKLEFSLINKNIYKDQLFNGRISRIQRNYHKSLIKIPFLRRFVQVEMKDTRLWENYPQGKNNYIFICVAKSASSSVNKILNHNIHPEPRFHHMGIDDVKKYYSNLDIDKYYKFAFVRNPWDRFLSLYYDMYFARNGNKKVMNYSKLEKKYKTIFFRTKNFKDFARSFQDSEWINETHFKPQFNYLSINGELCMDFIGKIENLKNDWSIIKKDIGFNYLPDIGHNRKSKLNKGNYKEHYDSETYEIVSRIYKKDIDFFGYDF